MTTDAPPPGVKTTKDATAPAADSQKLDAAVLKIAGVVVIGSIMAILDITVVGVAQNTFQSLWKISPASAAWTMTAYTLALAAVIPVTGWAADRFGTKRLYLTSIALFVGGSVLCATAWDIVPLVAFRAIQGLGGGMLMPLGMTILTKAAGPERIGRVMAVLGIPMLLGPIGGPILGGWLIDAVSWHWIFLINLPIGVIGFVYAFMALPKDNPSPSESFDRLGFILLSPGLAAFLYGVSSIPGSDTIMSAQVLIPALIGLVLIVAFVMHALKKKNALIDLHLFQNRDLTFAILTLVIFSIAFFGAMLIFPQYFIGIRGESPLKAGLLGAPMGIGAMLTMPIAGALTDRFGPGKFVLSGLVLIILGMIPMTMLEPDTSYWMTSGAFLVMGLGMGMTMMPTMTAALKTLTTHQVARGSTLTNITQQVAASIGTAVISVLLTNFLKRDPLSSLAIYANADPVNGGQALAGAAAQAGVPVDALLTQGLQTAADSFTSTITIAVIMVAFTLIPAYFLPRKPTAKSDTAAPAAAMLH
ncbi:MAG: DHA2 family efflux MFS transporter permease subunit [Nakamurella sp.]